MRNLQLKHHRDWDRDGVIRIENDKTLKRYHELNEEAYNVKLEEFDCFFAFNQKQLEEGLQRIGKTKSEIYKYGSGLFGTHEGFEAYMDFLDKKDEKIKKECDPQEIYFDEWNNHECMFNGKGDTPAIDIVIRIFGSEVVPTLKRYNWLYTYEQLLIRDTEEPIKGLTFNDGQTPPYVWFSDMDGKAYCHYDCALHPVYLNGKQFEADSKTKWGMSAYYKDNKLYKWHKQ